MHHTPVLPSSYLWIITHYAHLICLSLDNVHLDIVRRMSPSTFVSTSNCCMSLQVLALPIWWIATLVDTMMCHCGFDRHFPDGCDVAQLCVQFWAISTFFWRNIYLDLLPSFQRFSFYRWVKGPYTVSGSGETWEGGSHKHHRAPMVMSY